MNKQKHYVVTGGLGFIGSNIVKRLADEGHLISIVDYRNSAEKLNNVLSCITSVADIISPDDHAEIISVMNCSNGVFHQGACADTTLEDPDEMFKKNHDFTFSILSHCSENKKRCVWASSAAVYGNADQSKGEKISPLNVYAISKVLSESWLKRIITKNPYLVGLRYFNVYGQNESHKGKMMSMVNQLIDQASKNGRVRLFKDGEQKRDFVHVDDVVSVNMHFMFQSQTAGIFDVGTGNPRTFNELGQIIEKRLGKMIDWEYIEMPEKIRKFYQNNTAADLNKLRLDGYTGEFASLEEGVGKLLPEISEGDIVQ